MTRPLLSNTRRRRNTACAMLFVWLFALSSGVANACLTDPHGHHDHGSSQSHRLGTSETSHKDGDHAEAISHDDHGDGGAGGGPTKASCLKACDDGSRSLLKHSSGFDLADPGLAPFVSVAWTTEVQLAPASGRAHHIRVPERGPPIRVLFSRLAL